MIKKTISVLVMFLFYCSSIHSNGSCQQADQHPSLQIVSPSIVNESEHFYIQILLNMTPLANATVIFNQHTKYTNSTGYTSFNAPRVLPNGIATYQIIAYTSRLSPVYKNISILNRPQLFALLERTVIQAKKPFLITIIDDEGRLIEDATISFNNKQMRTDKNGSIILLAPNVNKSKLFNITLEKNGYINNTILIIVSPFGSSENVVGLYVSIGIFLMLSILSSVLLIQRYLKKKKINRRK